MKSKPKSDTLKNQKKSFSDTLKNQKRIFGVQKKSFSDTRIKRERWKNKYVVVVRERGKIATWKKYSKKEKIKTLKNRYKKNGSLIKDVKVTKLKNVKEIVNLTSNPKIPTGVMYSYYFQGILKDGTKITARSLQHPKGYPVKKAMREAEESFYERLAQSQGLKYDEDEGIKIAPKVLRKLKHGVVYYKSLKK